MNKKLITALIATTLAIPTGAHAAINNRTESLPTVAILDTAIDTTLPAFKGRIVDEVCILQTNSCPNGQSFMQGPGAASMPSDIIVKNGFDHGTQMTSVLMSSNPNMNVIFIKIIGNTSTGGRMNAGEKAVYQALEWVYSNASKYNIQAVTMAQGHHNLGSANTDYCPKTPITENAVKSLASIDVPVFFPSGNGRDYSRIDWPACLEVSQSVGYVDQINEISANSNNDSARLDFFTKGFFSVAGPGGVVKNISGSSAAIQVAAGNYLQIKTAKPGLSMNSVIDLMKSSAKKTVGRQGTFSKLIDVPSALSYSSPTTVVSNSGPTPQEIAAKKEAEALAAKLALKSQVDAAIAAAEAQYQIDLKAAQDKLAATKAQWMAKLNG